MTHLHYDVIIIGSGAGGGTVASRLAPLVADGLKIAVLEAGPHFPKEYFTQREIEMFDLFESGGAFPSADGAITASFGKAMGGSTVMYTGVTFRLPDPVCEEWNVDGISSSDLRNRFEKLEKELHVIEPDKEMENDNNRLFKEGCEKTGISVKKIFLNIKNCEQMGFCNLGCANDHKQGTLSVQLPAASRSGVELIPNCKVTDMFEKRIRAVVSKPPPGSLQGALHEGSYEFHANIIVLAGGTVGSSALLLKSGFKKEFPALGCYVTLHPAMTVYGIYPEKIKNYKGFPKIYYSSDFSNVPGYYLETAFYYPFITAKNLSLWGKDLKYVMNRYHNLMAIIILVHDDALVDNKIQLNRKNEPVLNYTLSDKSISAFCDAQAKASRIFFAAGCKEVVMPAAEKPLFSENDLKGKKPESFITPKTFIPNKIPVSTAHLQGGCRMGKDRKDSVTDCWGKVHGKDWLYVADGSIFPKSSHVNPYLTIMALADRVSERLIATKDQWLRKSPSTARGTSSTASGG